MGTARGGRQPAMMDVARLAGVSHQTVSRVVNDTGHVAEETRSRVLAAIEQLGYRRNSVARALVTRRSSIIGVITTTSAHYGSASLLVSLEAAAREAGFFTGVTALSDYSAASLAGAIDRFLGLAAEAVVVAAPVAGLAEAMGAMGAPVPVVAVSAVQCASPRLRSVRADQVGGARSAVRYLVERGHRDIVHIAGPGDWYEARAREAGWRAEMEERHLVPREPLGSSWECAGGYEAGRRLAAQGLPDAVFAANDAIALGLLRALDEAGARVPDDVSVVGFDDEPAAAFYGPGLTTVRQDFAELGRCAVRAVCDAITGEGAPGAVVVPTRLVERRSVADRRGQGTAGQRGSAGGVDKRAPWR